MFGGLSKLIDLRYIKTRCVRNIMAIDGKFSIPDNNVILIVTRVTTLVVLDNPQPSSSPGGLKGLNEVNSNNYNVEV
ncbi:hypothetical protein M8J76_001105 [Diaphorina citri]|nr:hypothetical protein M8J75_006213 [Diaphorina citri]KAI5718849.1 hypothetical protein M8J76_001105 [Diaphorina citri]